MTMLSINKKWTESMLRIPNPNITDGLYFMKHFYDDYGYGHKIWVKAIDGLGKLIYKFHSIYYFKRMDDRRRRRLEGQRA